MSIVINTQIHKFSDDNLAKRRGRESCNTPFHYLLRVKIQKKKWKKKQHATQTCSTHGIQHFTEFDHKFSDSIFGFRTFCISLFCCFVVVLFFFLSFLYFYSVLFLLVRRSQSHSPAHEYPNGPHICIWLHFHCFCWSPHNSLAYR